MKLFGKRTHDTIQPTFTLSKNALARAGTLFGIPWLHLSFRPFASSPNARLFKAPRAQGRSSAEAGKTAEIILSGVNQL